MHPRAILSTGLRCTPGEHGLGLLKYNVLLIQHGDAGPQTFVSHKRRDLGQSKFSIFPVQQRHSRRSPK